MCSGKVASVITWAEFMGFYDDYYKYIEDLFKNEGPYVHSVLEGQEMTPPQSQITVEQVQELLTELLDNASILTDREHSFAVWVSTTLADGLPITLQHAQQIQAVYNQMINRQFGG